MYVPARERDGGTHGLAILSAFPIADVEKMELPDFGKGRLRIALRASILVGDRRVEIINLHLDTKLNTQERIAHLHPVAIDAPAAVLVGGDFNTS